MCAVGKPQSEVGAEIGSACGKKRKVLGIVGIDEWLQKAQRRI